MAVSPPYIQSYVIYQLGICPGVMQNGLGKSIMSSCHENCRKSDVHEADDGSLLRLVGVLSLQSARPSRIVPSPTSQCQLRNGPCARCIVSASTYSGESSAARLQCAIQDFVIEDNGRDQRRQKAEAPVHSV